jgi:hypothetical protein
MPDPKQTGPQGDAPLSEAPHDADGNPVTLDGIVAQFRDTIFWNDNRLPPHRPPHEAEHALEVLDPAPPAYCVDQTDDGGPYKPILLRFHSGELTVDVAEFPEQGDDADVGNVTSKADAKFVANLPVFVPFLLAALSAAPGASGGTKPTEPMRPMTTAPKDGTEVLLQVEWRAGIRGKFLVGHYMPGGHCIEDHPPIDEGWYFWNGCMFDRASKPVGWLPLPASAPGGTTQNQPEAR